jgi:hypothetical protein
MVVNGLIGTVLSELLWLLGCFYTSSLVATLAISLTIPLTMLADVLVKERGDRLDNSFLKKHVHFFYNIFFIKPNKIKIETPKLSITECFFV